MSHAFLVAVYAAVKKMFDERKRPTDQCICGLRYHNQVAEIANEMGLYNDPKLVDKILGIVSSNLNCVSLEEMCGSAQPCICSFTDRISSIRF